MSRKRVCDLCEKDIADPERYYDVLVDVKIAGDEARAKAKKARAKAKKARKGPSL